MSQIASVLNEFEAFVKSVYAPETPVLLHRPVFEGNEKLYLNECIDSNFVSSVGAKVTEFEQKMAAFTGAKYAIATVNGTAALHVALELAGVHSDDEVICQALSFIATCNAVSYIGAVPVFVDVDQSSLGMSADAVKNFLHKHAELKNGVAYNKTSGRRLSACVPMHTFGHPCDIVSLVAVCNEYNIPVVEDAAESLGSYVDGRHTGTFGLMGIFSFNGNKIITTGGGGMLVTNDSALAERAKHITTTAKIPHPYEYVHDEIGYNYRLPNLNAALGCAQMEQLDYFVKCKRDLASQYQSFFLKSGIVFVNEPNGCSSNYWLNAVQLESLEQRNEFLQHTNANGVMTRPIWRLMNRLDMFKHCQNDGLPNATWLEGRIVNIPSSVSIKMVKEKS
jgi:perosamine synthetase